MVASGTSRLEHRLDRRRLLTTSLVAVAGISSISRAVAQNASPVASPQPISSADWPLPGADLAGTRAAVTSIDASNVAAVAPAWTTDIGGTVAGTPVVAGGSVFVVTWDGVLTALDLKSGASRWTFDFGVSVADPMFGGTIGAAGGAAVDSGLVFAGDAGGTLHAVDASNGTEHWSTKVDEQNGSAILAAPTVWGGLVYAPVAVLNGDTTFKGSLVAVSTSDGSIAWQRSFALADGRGGAAASTPAIDSDSGQLFLSVGASNSAPSAVFALDAKTGDVLWQSAIDLSADAPTDLPLPAAAVNLATITIDGAAHAAVGGGFPDGIYRLFDRADGTLLWERNVSFGGPFGGILGAAATVDGTVVVPATNWSTVDAPANGAIMAIDAATGNFDWMSITANPALTPVSIANDVVFYGGLDGIVRADALSSGSHLWSDQLDASIGSGIAILDRTIIFGTGAPAVGSFVKPGTSVVAYALATEGTPVASSAGEPEATPVAAPTEKPTPAGAVFEASMQSIKFIPAEIDIPAGTTVVWTNKDVVAHTVTHRVKVEDQLFSSPLLAPGDTFSYTFDKPGTYPIYCMPHPFMTETVVVS